MVVELENSNWSGEASDYFLLKTMEIMQHSIAYRSLLSILGGTLATTARAQERRRSRRFLWLVSPTAPRALVAQHVYLQPPRADLASPRRRAGAAERVELWRRRRQPLPAGCWMLDAGCVRPPSVGTSDPATRRDWRGYIHSVRMQTPPLCPCSSSSSPHSIPNYLMYDRLH